MAGKRGGVIAAAVALVVVLVLRTGIAHGRANVQAMLEALEQRKGSSAS